MEERRLLAAGDLDPTFGDHGKILTDFTVPVDLAGNDFGRQVAIQQSDGKIVVAGGSVSEASSADAVALARYNTNGSLDTTFGDGGRVRDTFPTLFAVTGMALQVNKIVVAGYTFGFNGGDFFLARYNGDGTLDTSFDGDGWLTTDFGDTDDRALGITIQENGKIIVAGVSDQGEVTGFDFAVARYDSDGTLDTSFDGDGLVTTDFGFDHDFALSVAVQGNGRIVVAGSSQQDFDSHFALARYNRDGSLDTNFDGDGLVITDVGGFDESVNSLAIQTDGKIVAAGSSNQFESDTSYDFALVRYNSNGTQDSSFGVGGVVTTDFGSSDFAKSVAVQADGRIVAAGNSGDDFAVARYNRNGGLDTTFDSDGKVTTDFGDSDDVANSVAIQRNGKIVAAGYSYQGDPTGYDFAVARYNVNGALDTSFDSDGKVTTEFPVLFISSHDAGRQVAIQQPDGKIVVAGSSAFIPFAPPDAIALARYNTDGTLDSTFGVDGLVRDSFLIFPEITSMALQSDGKILVAGIAFGPTSRDFFVARYNSDGTLDVSFGGGGGLLTDVGENTDDLAASVAVQSDGKIVVAGSSAPEFTVDYDFAVARYTSGGVLDTSFGTEGVVTTDFGGTADIAFSMALDSNGKIVVVGSTVPDESLDFDFALARYTSAGTLDESFGEDGIVITDFGASTDIASSVAMQTDGKIVVAGVSNVNGLADFALARYDQSGALDNSFDGDGLVLTDFAGAEEWAFSVAVQPDGKIVAAGLSFQGSTGYDFALARYKSSGALDAGFGTDGRVTTDFGSPNDLAQSVVVQADGKIVVAGASDQGNRLGDFAVARYEGLFTGAVLETDTCDPTKTQLVVGGTRGDDKIKIHKVGNTGDVEVKLNGESLGTFSPTGRIIVHGYAGDDDIQLSGGISNAAWLYGGAGDDRLSGGAADDVLLGGEGDDLLHGGSGRDLLIGGNGSDRLVGNSDDDILVAGVTDHDASEAALCEIMEEWTRAGASFATRVAHLKGPVGGGTVGGNNGTVYLNDQTVHDDGCKDVLTGDSGNDWFLFNRDGDGDPSKKDKATDMSTFEAMFAQDIDFIDSTS